jgi:arylesterase/paraoxonase
LWLKRPGSSSIVYCHVNTGCKVATENLLAANGLARAPSSTTATGMDKFYVANHLFPQIKVLERQADDTLVVTDDVEIRELSTSNLSSDHTV